MKNFAEPYATIQSEIDRIFNLLEMQADDDTVVKTEKPRPGAGCRGMICIFDREEWHRGLTEKGYKATPIVRYAFYPDVYFPSRLGSVAIYGADAATTCRVLNSRRDLFGLRVSSAAVEYGRRPFVDVRLRA